MASNKFEVGFVFGAKKAATFDKTFKGISKSMSDIKGMTTNVIKGIAGIAGAYVGVSAINGAIKTTAKLVNQFGELEQNLGGSEAVFGNYAASIQKAGENAYKNLGVTQSEYLATANKMGALFQGSGIEQAKSLELTEKAMQRASDMASVMGIDMQVALDSVAGAAKGNFTMMDNLGVAMNATNIQAYALEKGINFKWNTATQAEKAEVAMQMFFENTEQYAGNFAREATQTVTGSIGLLKAAWGSFTAGLGNEKADMGNLTENVIDAFKAVTTNVKPIVKNIVSSLPKAFSTAFSVLPEIFSETLSTIFPRAGPAITKMSQSMGRSFKAIGDSGKKAIQFIKSKWDQYGPGIIAFVVDVKNKAVDSFNWMRDKGREAIQLIKQKWDQHGPAIITFVKNVKDKAIEAFTWIRDTGQTAIGNIQAKFQEIKPHVDGFIGMIVDIGTKVHDKMQVAFEVAEPIISWVATEGLPLVVGVMGGVLGIATDIYDFFNSNWPLIEGLVIAVGLAFAAWNLPTVLATGIESISAISGAVVTLPGKIAAATTAWWGSVSAKVADKAVTLQLCGLYAKDFFVAIWSNVKAVGASTASWVANKAMMIGSKVAMLALKGAQLISTGATAAMTAAQWALNAAFIASPIGWVVLAIGALIAIGVLLYKNWDVVKAKAIQLWTGIKGAFGSAVGWFKGIWDGVTATFQTFMDGLAQKFPMLADIIMVPINAIKGHIEGLKMIFTGIIDFVAGVFTGDWSRAWEGVKGIFGGVFQSFSSLAKTPINAVIAILNGAIRGINKINVDVPDWVPGIGGKSFGFAIPEIPMLAKGGIATAPTLAMVGEGKESEAILPLSKLSGMLNAPIGAIASLLQRFLDAVDNGGGGGGDVFNFNPQLVFNGPVNKAEVQSALGEAYEQWKKFMMQYDRDASRKSLKPRK